MAREAGEASRRNKLQKYIQHFKTLTHGFRTNQHCSARLEKATELPSSPTPPPLHEEGLKGNSAHHTTRLTPQHQH